MTVMSGEELLRDVQRHGLRLFSIAVVFSFVFNLLRLSGPLFILLMHDRVLSSRSQETLVVLFLLLVCFLAVMGLVDYARRRLLARLGGQIQERLENYIFSATPKEQLFKRNLIRPAPALVEVDALRSFLHGSAIFSILDVAWTPMFLIIIFIFSPLLGWVVVAGLILMLILNIVKTQFAEDKRERARNASRNVDDLKSTLHFSNHLVRSQSIGSAFNVKWMKTRRESRDSSIELSDWTSWFTTFSTQIKMLIQYSVLALGAYLVISEELTVGAMFASMFLSVRVFTPVEQFLKELPNISAVRADWRVVQKKLRPMSVLQEHSDLWDLEPKLTLKNLTKTSPHSGARILRSVNLTIDSGTIVEIIGKSGAGKTVLAESIVGAMPKTSGMVICGGSNVTRLSILQSRNLMGYVPEMPVLLNGTLEENISGLANDLDTERLFAAANTARIHHIILGLPDGYQTRIKKNHSPFSKGFLHQISLARALYSQPKILIFDEPDLILHEVIATDLKAEMDKTGGIILILSRERIPLLPSNRRYYLDGGKLKKRAPVNTVRLDTLAPQLSDNPEGND